MYFTDSPSVKSGSGVVSLPKVVSIQQYSKKTTCAVEYSHYSTPFICMYMYIHIRINQHMYTICTYVYIHILGNDHLLVGGGGALRMGLCTSTTEEVVPILLTTDCLC